MFAVTKKERKETLMAVNARTEEFQHLEVFDKPALFTNARIDRSTVPEGWYCYDIRGSDDDPGELCYMEENVVVNHAGSVLMPEKLAMPKSGRLDVRDELGFLDEGNMTLREFCEAHQLSYPAENMKFHIRPARPDEAGLFYTPHPEEDKRLGAIGCVRMDIQRQNMARDKPLVGRVTYANGDAQEFTDAEAFLKCVREELPYHPTTGFRYEVLTDDPSVRKQVDDMIFDFYGEENPRQLEEYQKTPKQGMTMGGIK